MIFTTQDLNSYLGGELTVTEDHAETLRQMVSGYIEGYTKLKLQRVTDGQAIVPGGALLLIPPRRPVVDVSEIAYRDWETGNVWTPLDSEDWLLTPAGVERAYGYGWPLRWYRITYTYGFETVPNEISSAALRAAANLATNPSITRSEGLGSYNVTYAGTDEDVARVISPDLRDVLRPYRKRGRTGALSL